jgi:hypothetical protein
LSEIFIGNIEMGNYRGARNYASFDSVLTTYYVTSSLYATRREAQQALNMGIIPKISFLIHTLKNRRKCGEHIFRR